VSILLVRGDDGSTELWDDVIAGHKNPGSSYGVYPKERTGRKTRKNPRLEPDSKLFSNSDEKIRFMNNLCEVLLIDYLTLRQYYL